MQSGIQAYARAQQSDPRDLTVRALRSIELYIHDLENTELDWATRCEAGIAAITLANEMSINMRPDLPEQEQIILIKVFGQIIKNINRCMRGEHKDLSKELAGVRLIRKLVL